MMSVQLHIDSYARLSHIFFGMGNPYTLTSFLPISSSATVQRNLKEKLHKENTSHELPPKESESSTNRMICQPCGAGEIATE